MSIFLPFISGFAAAMISLFPGLINLTAAKVSMSDGRTRGFVFVIGALLIIYLQTYLSVVFAQYINAHEQIVILLREIGIGIFTGSSIYFLFFAKKPQIKLDEDTLQLKRKRSRFFMGMLISAINFLTIPYYVLVSVTLASFKIFTFDSVSINSLVFGVVFGSFSVFSCYVIFFNKMKSKTDYFLRNMNNIIGIVTGLIAVITLINVINHYL